MSAVQLVKQADPLQAYAPHAIVLAPHVPAPSQSWVVCVPEAHVCGAQTVPLATSSHCPEAAQLPVLPHGGTGVHCPLGAGVPAVKGEQTPSAAPVSALMHPMHVPLHA